MEKQKRQRTSYGRTVYVINDDVTKAIKKLRRIIRQSEVFIEYKEHCQYIKPSIKQKRKRQIKLFKCRCAQKQFEKKLKQI